MVVFWGVEVKPGKPYRHIPEGGHGSQLHLSQATLGVGGTAKERVLLSVAVAGSPTPGEILICSLTAGSVESCALDLIFDSEATFKVTGSTSLHLTGYYMPISLDHECDDSDCEEHGMLEGSDDDDEEAEFTDEFEDDDGDDDDSLDDEDDEMEEAMVPGSSVVIEELEDEDTPKAAPRLALTAPDTPGSDKKEADKKGGKGAKGTDADKDPSAAPGVSAAKKDKKKDKKDKMAAAAAANGVAKETKAAEPDQNGAAEAAPAGDTGKDGAEEDEDGFLVSGKRPAADAGAADKPKKKQAVASSGDTPAAIAVTPTEAKAAGGEEKGEEGKASKPVEKALSKKAKKAAAAAAAAANETATAVTPAEPVANGQQQQQLETKKAKSKKETPEVAEPEAKAGKAKGKAEKTEKKTAGSEGQKEGKAAAASPKTPEAKPAEKAAKAKAATPVVRRYPNGLEVQEVALGKPNGKQATPGKKIFMHYTGRLKSSGKQFDSSRSSKPFSFRLGVGEVIKGWDVGVQGMRVGDKRTLVIPPAMGYGAQGAPGTIPGNAWLVFDVELVDVK